MRRVTRRRPAAPVGESPDSSDSASDGSSSGDTATTTTTTASVGAGVGSSNGVRTRSAASRERLRLGPDSGHEEAAAAVGALDGDTDGPMAAPTVQLARGIGQGIRGDNIRDTVIGDSDNSDDSDDSSSSSSSSDGGGGGSGRGGGSFDSGSSGPRHHVAIDPSVREAVVTGGASGGAPAGDVGARRGLSVGLRAALSRVRDAAYWEALSLRHPQVIVQSLSQFLHPSLSDDATARLLRRTLASTRDDPIRLDNDDAPPTASTTTTTQHREIDLTVSDSDNDDERSGSGRQGPAGGANALGEADEDDDDVVIVGNTTPAPGGPSWPLPMPAPTPTATVAATPAGLSRKRRRRAEAPAVAPAGGSAVATTAAVPSMFDMSRAESTNISLENNEVIEQFKRALKCSICLDVIDEMTSTICGHVYCAHCIKLAIRVTGKCPLCQRNLRPKDIHGLFF